MAGVKLAALDYGECQMAWPRRYRYDHAAMTLYLDPWLTVQETSHICDEVLDLVVSRSLAELSRLGPSPAE